MVEIFEMNKNTENLFSEELFSAQIESLFAKLWCRLDNSTCERRYHFLTFLLMMFENNGKNPHSENRAVSMSASVR